MVSKPRLFEELVRHMKRKERAQCSRRQPKDTPLSSSSEDDSDDHHPKRKKEKENLMKLKCKVHSKVSSASRALLKNPFQRKDNREGSRYGLALYGDYMRASHFTPDINEEVFLANFKLPNVPFYDGK